MRYGLIGCGGIGALRAQALATLPGAKLMWVSDTDMRRAQALASGHGASATREWRTLVERADVDAVIVSTPPNLHAEMAIGALEAGKHVLVEKPIARDPVEGRAMLAAAASARRHLGVGFNYRFYPSMLRAQELLARGIIGELDHIRSYAGYSATGHNPLWVHDAAVMGGGALRDNGIHLIDLTRLFLGEVAEVKGFASDHVWGFEGCEDNGFALLRGANGRIASLQASWNEWRGYQLLVEIYGERGCIRSWCFPMKTEVTWSAQRAGRMRTKTDRFLGTMAMEHLKSYRWVVVQSFIAEQQEFERAARGEPSRAASGRDGVEALQIAHTVAHAASVRRESVAAATPVAVAVPARAATSLAGAEAGGRPQLSVVVVVLAGREYLVRALEALEGQQGVERPEIIVPHDETLSDVAALGRRFPAVRFLPHEGRKTFAELRAAGFRAARGDIVAVTEDQCSAEPTWASSILELHQGPWAAVGGPVDKRGPDTMLNWALYLSDYGRYMEPVVEGPAGYLTDTNVTYKRASLEATSQLWQKEFHETTVNWALQDQGKQLLLSRRAVMRQQRTLRLGRALGERYRFGRLFASTRVAGASPARRVLYAGASAVLPAILLLRVYRNIFGKRRFDTPFLRIAPVLVLLNVVWAWGEVMGYLTGRAVPALRPAVAAQPQTVEAAS